MSGRTGMATTASTRDFPLAPLQRGTWLSALAIPAAALAAGLLIPDGGATRLPVPPWLFALFVAALIAVPIWLALLRRRIQLRSGELKVASTFYTRKVPAQALDLDKARVMDLAEHTEFKPRWKTNGFNLIGFQSGHYRLRNGWKAFCLLSDTRRVLVLPQHDGKVLLLSPGQPQALLDALRREAPGPHLQRRR